MPFMGMRNHQLRPPRGLFMFPPQADKVSVIIHGVLVISRSVGRIHSAIRIPHSANLPYQYKNLSFRNRLGMG